MPTLCSTPVATSAMPASREASRNCDLQFALALFLQHLVGHVPGHAEDAYGIAVLIAEDARMRLEVHGAARRSHHAEAEVADLLPLRHGRR